MPKGNRDADKLAKCARKHEGDLDEIKKCVATYSASGGSSEPVDEGGTFFTDQDGGKVFISDGGKVFG